MGSIFLFLFLVIFPFGQIIRIGILQPIDAVVGVAALVTIIKKYPRPEVFKYFQNFLLVAGFSWILSVFIFKQVEVLYGLLYLLRLAAYVYFIVYVWNFAKNKANKILLTNSLIAISVASAVFGWIQYFSFSSLGPFFVWGWDEHLFRLVGTFLDPTFLGLILVFGTLTIIYRYMIVKGAWRLFTAGFMIVTLAFTYSRGSYLALFAGLLVLAYYKKMFTKIILVILAFLGLMLLLPTSKNHVLSFTRSFSAIDRIGNYIDTFGVIKTSPAFGVGYDNLCLFNAKDSGYINFRSHACSGSDSSLLFILATTGVTGFIIFVFAVLKSLQYTKYHILYTSALASLLVHSLFSNSLVYPWIMGYMVILLGVSLRSKVES